MCKSSAHPAGYIMKEETKKEARNAFLVMGILWLAFGGLYLNASIVAMGILIIAIGLAIHAIVRRNEKK
jgi:uncharacterized membrane protein HdeD (DUF308 family)